MGDLYDISLTVNFDFAQATQNKVTVECRAVGENAELFSLSTKVDLLFPNVLPTEQRSYTSTITIIAVVVTMMIIITAAVVIICRMKARKTKMKRTKRSDLESEGIPMMANTNEKKNDLIKYAKIAYQKQYGTAKPFPSMNERSVDSIFVEGGIYYVAQKGDSKQNPDVLESLESYNEILSSPKTESKENY
ncbi:hypothetical protein BSL78_20768 [Apostichopus japonicus]|uniref:Uncharacterized protein n=1 Tax=Stichopus japonicus TaxID=307972 RepID=A0A2G8K2Z7_STIJA|nr:hypothetical protein BSL78_20768 [Apostichopus japonicus]